MWLRCLSLDLETAQRKGTFVTSTREQNRQGEGCLPLTARPDGIDRVKGRDDGHVNLGTLRLLRYQAELGGHSAELGKRTGVHLPHRVAAVDLHRWFADTNIAGNLFAKATSCDLNHDFTLSGA